MKLKELSIPNHKGFVDFVTTFDQEAPITTIIGQNGVGKSNLIEIIVSIFRSIDLGESSEFSYKLTYECRGHNVEIQFDAGNAKNNVTSINGKKKTLTFLKNNANEYLPLNIFTYYSGTNWRVEKLFLRHQTRFYNQLTEGDDSLLRRFFYCRDEHSFFVLLAFLVDDDSASKAIIDKLGITSLDSVLFCLKKPYWFKGKPNDIMLKEGDPRFWYSRGIVKDFLGHLWSQAIAPIDSKERKIIDFRGRAEQQDRLYLFLPNKEALKALSNNYPNTASLFKNLESTYIADILEKTDVTVTLNTGKQVTFNQLSEGERQLLTVLGLIKFTRDDESLFLLDEPDTHLNPRWKLDYFEQIKKILDYKIEGSEKTAWDSSQIILTTHDPVMLTSLYANQIRVLTKGADGKTTSTPPTEDPISMGVEAIMQSELYGIRTSLDITLQEKIDRRNELLALISGTSFDEEGNLIQGEKCTKTEEKTLKVELNKLNSELDIQGFTFVHPDPYFSNFAKALSRSADFKQPVFDDEEYQRIQNLSDKLLARAIENGALDD